MRRLAKNNVCTRRRLLALAPILLAGACAREPEIDRNALTGPTDDLVVARDVAYASGDRRALDIYAPRKAAPDLPVIIYIYGGAWAAGSKAECAWIGAALARRGFVAVIPDYRIYPQGLWPDFIQDNAAAVRWTVDNVKAHGGDPARIVLMGHSAGAFNAFTLAVDRRWLGAVGLEPQKAIKAVIGLAGPYRMSPPDAGRETEIFGPGRGYSEPADHIDGKSPPLLLLVGATDRAAGPELSTEMAELVRAKGASARAILYPGVTHSGIQEAIGGAPAPSADQILQDISGFLAETGVSQPH